MAIIALSRPSDPAGAPAPVRAQTAVPAAAPARVNGVALHRADEALDEATLRQRACTELLRQAAIDAGLLEAGDPPAEDGVPTEAASLAVERLLDAQLRVPEPSDEACERHFAARQAQYRQGERVLARHVLFAVTPGVDVRRLRGRAEQALLDLRADPGLFAERAGALSNCPSGGRGGDLGWLTPDACAPEFARELFGREEVGVLARLVHSRFGLHLVEVLAREPGVVPRFESVRPAVAQSLRQQAFVNALRQYLTLLAGRAELEGVALERADTPLVQ